MRDKTSKQTRKRHSAEFKAKVVVAPLREDKTLNQLSTEFGVHPVVISAWKKQVLLALTGIFGQRAERDAQAVELRERELFERIGRLEVETRWLKKSSALSLEARRAMMDCEDELSVRRPRELQGLDRSGLYHWPASPSAGEIALCHRLVELYTAHPFYGVRRMPEALRREGAAVNPKRMRRLLRQMGLLAAYLKPRLSQPALGQSVFPYLLRGLAIERPHQVWAVDLTHVRLRGGFADLMALLD